jgi:pivalyl-CoA mutase small subunit
MKRMTQTVSETADTTPVPARVLVTKIGLDGHDRGSRIVASYLRDAGMEVIYTPPWQSISSVVNIALQEDVELIGISSLATDHLIIPELTKELREAGLGDVGIIVGGIIPDKEKPALLDAGVHEVFGPGATREEIVEGASRLVAQTRNSRGGVQ